MTVAIEPKLPKNMSRPELLALVEVLSAFGAVEAAVRAALEGVPSGGVGATRAALAVSLARQIDEPGEKVKLSEIASASKELRAILKELDLDGDGDEGGFGSDLPTPVGDPSET